MAWVAVQGSRVIAPKSRSYPSQDPDNAGVRKRLRGPGADSSLPTLDGPLQVRKSSWMLAQLEVYRAQSPTTPLKC